MGQPQRKRRRGHDRRIGTIVYGQGSVLKFSATGDVVLAQPVTGFLDHPHTLDVRDFHHLLRSYLHDQVMNVVGLQSRQVDLIDDTDAAFCHGTLYIGGAVTGDQIDVEHVTVATDSLGGGQFETTDPLRDLVGRVIRQQRIDLAPALKCRQDLGAVDPHDVSSIGDVPASQSTPIRAAHFTGEFVETKLQFVRHSFSEMNQPVTLDKLTSDLERPVQLRRNRGLLIEAKTSIPCINHVRKVLPGVVGTMEGRKNRIRIPATKVLLATAT